MNELSIEPRRPGNPRAAGLLVAGVLVVLGALTAFIAVRWQRMCELSRDLKRLGAERRVLRQASPELTPAQATALAAQLAELQARGRVATRPWRATFDPKGSDPFLRLAEFVRDSRGELDRAGVTLAPVERLGFADCLERPPAEVDWPRLQHEWTLIDAAIHALVASGARELRSLQRRTVLDAEHERATTPPGLPRRRIGPLARIEIGFVGDTAALRRFVNALLEREPRLWIESIGAEARDAKLGSEGGALFTVRLARPCWVDEEKGDS